MTAAFEATAAIKKSRFLREGIGFLGRRRLAVGSAVMFYRVK